MTSNSKRKFSVSKANTIASMLQLTTKFNIIFSPNMTCSIFDIQLSSSDGLNFSLRKLRRVYSSAAGNAQFFSLH